MIKFNKTLFFIDVLLPLMDKHLPFEIKAMPRIMEQIEKLYKGNIDDGFKNWRRRDLENWRQRNKINYSSQDTLKEPKPPKELKPIKMKKEKVLKPARLIIDSLPAELKKSLKQDIEREAKQIKTEEQATQERKITFGTEMAEIVCTQSKKKLIPIFKDMDDFRVHVITIHKEREEIKKTLKAKRKEYNEWSLKLRKIEIDGVSFENDASKQILNEMERMEYTDEIEGKSEEGEINKKRQQKKTTVKEQYVNSYIQISDMINSKLSVINAEIINLKGELQDYESDVRFYKSVNEVDLSYLAQVKMMGDTFKTLAEGDNFLKEKGMTQILETNQTSHLAKITNSQRNVPELFAIQEKIDKLAEAHFSQDLEKK